jgi:hypothetical protein
VTRVLSLQDFLLEGEASDEVEVDGEEDEDEDFVVEQNSLLNQDCFLGFLVLSDDTSDTW